MKTMRFGPLQYRIMNVLWDRGETTAKEITKALGEEGEVAHSTVQTLLRQLEEKGAIDHCLRGRTFVFFPLIERTKAVGSATRDLIDRVFDGSAAGLVAHLLKHERISRGELNAIRRLIDPEE